MNCYSVDLFDPAESPWHSGGTFCSLYLILAKQLEIVGAEEMGLMKNGAEPSCPVPGKGARRVLETEPCHARRDHLTVSYLCVIPLT